MSETVTPESSLPVVVIAENIFPAVDQLLAHFAGQAEFRFADLSTVESTSRGTKGADALVVATQQLDAARIEALSSTVRVIGRAGVGLDSIDLSAVAAHGVALVSQPTYGANEVASHAVAMMLALQRKLVMSDQFVRNGWSGDFALAPMKPLDEMTLGLVGCGRIGAETVRMARELVGRVVVHDPHATSLPPGVEEGWSLDDVLAASDILSLHLPLTDETRGLLGARELALLPQGAIVANVARGGILDEDALSDALRSGHIGGAGLDVFAEEPVSTSSPLLSAPNMLFSPHVAAFSDRSTWRLGAWTIGDVLSWLGDGTIENGRIVVDAPAGGVR
jgi:D-3-phosphoglycerate dehydrogenase